MPFFLKAGLPWMCVLGNFPPFTKNTLMPSSSTLMPTNAIIIKATFTCCRSF